MKYEEILSEIGDYGPYQRKAYFMLCVPAAMKSMIIMSAVFVLSLPDYRCAIPGLKNDTFEERSEYHQILLNRTVPLAPPDQDGGVYSHCTVYANSSLDPQGQGHSVSSLNLTGSDAGVVSCQAWVYDTSEVDTSIMTEFDLVCDNKAMRSHTNMGFFGGCLVGSFLIGVVSDIVGRKKGMLLCVVLQIVCGTSLYFITSLVAVVVVRSIQGMAGEIFAISASTGMELVGPSKRTFAGMVVEFFWGGGQLLVLLVAYLSRDWRVQELVFGIAAVPILIVVCFTPESPRWLLDKGRYAEAEKILSKIAKSNKTQLPAGIFKHEAHELSTTEKSAAETAPQSPPTAAAAVTEANITADLNYNIWKLFSNRTLLIRSLIVFYNWFAVNFLYYGLSLNLDNLSGSLYLNFLISLAAEIVGFILCILLLDRTGRKFLYILCMLIGAVACLCVNFPVVFGNEDHQWITTTLSMIGKLVASACYSILYIMTVELFPTVVRNSALGACAVFENIGGMTSPYIADLGILVGGSLSKALPTTVFGGVALVAGLISLVLPETLHKPMPETIDDAIMMMKESKTNSRSYDLNQ